MGKKGAWHLFCGNDTLTPKVKKISRRMLINFENSLK
jgi:hypothetical protein